MSTTSTGDAGDYSYDMAHEDVLPREDTPSVATAQGEAPVVGPSDTEGDLSYDLAHEVPGSDA